MSTCLLKQSTKFMRRLYHFFISFILSFTFLLSFSLFSSFFISLINFSLSQHQQILLFFFPCLFLSVLKFLAFAFSKNHSAILSTSATKSVFLTYFFLHQNHFILGICLFFVFLLLLLHPLFCLSC